MGFLIQSRNAKTDEPEGEFILTNKPDEPFRMQYLDCDGGGKSTITHTDNDPKSQMKLVWRPNHSDTEYYFQYTIVKDYNNIWIAQKTVKFSLN